MPPLNYLLASHVWPPGPQWFTPGPGFIDHVVNKKAEIVRVYLPPDATALLSVMDPLPTQPPLVTRRDPGKHPAPQWLTIGRRRQTLHRGIASGSGPQHQGVAPPVIAAVATCPRSRRGAVSIPARASARTETRVVTLSTHEAEPHRASTD